MTRMPFGKFRGCLVDELPDWYLGWIAPRAYGELRYELEREIQAREAAETSRGDSNGSSVSLRIERLDLPLIREVITRGYKAAARVHHPDKGGSLEMMRRLNAVAETLRQQLEEICS